MTIQRAVEQMGAAVRGAWPSHSSDPQRSGIIIGRVGELQELLNPGFSDWSQLDVLERIAGKTFDLVQQFVDISDVRVGADSHPTKISALAALAAAMTEEFPRLKEGEERLRKVAHQLLAHPQASEDQAEELLVVAAEMIGLASQKHITVLRGR